MALIDLIEKTARLLAEKQQALTTLRLTSSSDPIFS
jgi:hypothetical protein